MSYETPQPAAAQPAPAGPAVPKEGNGLAVTGFVLGLLGLLLCWIPVLNFLGILLGILGVIFGAIGWVKSKRVNAGRGPAIAGLVMGALAIILAIVINVAFVNSVDDALDDDDSDVPHSTVAASPSTSGDASEPPSDSDSEGEASFVNGVLTTSDLKIEITDHKVIQPGKKGNEYGDKPVIAFWYTTTNLTDKDTDPTTSFMFNISAYQDNNPDAENTLDVGGLPDDRFSDTQMENIKKGGTVENAIAYELDDLTTPVDLVANDSLGFGDDLGRVTYNLK